VIPTGDSFTKLDKPTNNQGTSNKMEVKVQAPDKLNRGFMQFDISSIPAGATIDSATLTLCESRSGTGTPTIGVH